MKKLLFFLLLVAISHSQNIELYGSFYGHNSYLVNKDDTKAPDSLLTPLPTKRLGAGMGISFGLLNKIFVGGELYYSAEGQKYEGKLKSGPTFEGFYQVNYLKLPLFLEYRKNFAKAYISLRGGPQIWLLVAGQTTSTFYYPNSNKKDTFLDILADKDSMYVTIYLPSFSGGFDIQERTYAFSRIPHNLLLFGGWGSIGIGFNFSKKLGIDLNARIDYALTDNEAKETIRTNKDDPTDTREVWAVSPRLHDLDTPKDFKASDRPKTHNMTIGIQTRIHYKIR